jgi:hypothetical protein
MQGVPTRFVRRCEVEECGRELDTRAAGSCQRISGWAEQRSGGGAHGIIDREVEDRWAHRFCLERKRRGFLQQGAMF